MTAYNRVKTSPILGFFLLWTACLIGNMGFLAAQDVLSGRVYDKATGQGLVGARVVIPSAQVGTLTDEKGEFTLRTSAEVPYTIQVTYIGYQTLEQEISQTDKPLKLAMEAVGVTVGEVEIVSSAAQERQKQSPLTIERLSVTAIKETPAISFYEGLGHLKGVDVTAASLGFKVVNTRGFNSTSPVRSLQLIDGVDNQSPGLNFSLGNFLGASELDVESVDMVVGASSAYYGPGAFNGVISMKTKSPFVHPGVSFMLKGGERGLLQAALRYASILDANEYNEEKFAFKLNLSLMRADDWEAD